MPKSNISFDLSSERVVVVGNGNVAMDVARILVTPPDLLSTTDITDYALDALRQSKIREVVMLGRRGPAQAAFTNPELKEFGELPGVAVIVDPQDLVLDQASAAALETDKGAKKNLETLKAYAAKTDHNRNGERKLVMRFLVSPVELMGENGKITHVKIEKNQLVAQADGSIRPQGTGHYETLEVGLVFRSVGYKGTALVDVPFDEKSGTIPNQAGRVTHNGAVVAGEYVVGWAKRGPSGIIGTNKPDSAATVNSMKEDLAKEDLAALPLISDEKRDRNLIETLLQERGVDFVTYHDWRKIDQAEIERGVPHGRPRIKYHTVADMLKLCR